MLGHESLGRVSTRAQQLAVRRGPGRPHRQASRPHAVPQLRGQASGTAGTGSAPNAASRKSTGHVGALAHRTQVRDQGRPLLGLLGVLLEPTTVVTKAWEQVAGGAGTVLLGTGDRARDRRRPIGLLAALIGKQRGLDVHVLDGMDTGRSRTSCAPWGRLITGRASGVGFQPDVIVECTGVGQVIGDSNQRRWRRGVVCLTGRGERRAQRRAHRRQTSAPTSVLRNNVVVGSVNANKRHWYRAGQVLAKADRAWLAAS